VTTSAEKTQPLLERVTVLANERVARGVGALRLSAAGIASRVRPGQFIHLRIAAGADFILRRPFAVHRREGDAIELLYQTVGRGTHELESRRAGEVMDAIGPLGHGWEVGDVSSALLVAGGLGAAPLGMLAEDLARRGVAVTVALGAPSAERLLARSLFESVARRVEIATEDGSAGERGLVTALTARRLAEETPDVVCACGPEAMSRAVAAQAHEARVPCLVSLERLMACGIGACLSCAVSTTHGSKRACRRGPVFDAEEVLWDVSEAPAHH
jgi:dihydroorotate dehydrogenase electron transfer subunit